MIIHYLQYQFTLATLLIKGEIDFAMWRFAAWNLPVVVCGKHHGIVVDATFDMEPSRRSRIAMIEFMVGCLLVSVGIAKMDAAFSAKVLDSALYPDVFAAFVVFTLGILAAMDASIVAAHRWMPHPTTVEGAKDAANPS